jgi:hypothetical protein
MEVILYSDFSKRTNSTKNPESPGAISVSVTKEVKLKDNCSLIRPSFFISDVTGFVYLKAWNWYYFIKNIAYDINGAQYIDCEIDVLGTWRNSIKATTAYVEYSSSNYDSNVMDSRIAHRITKQYREEIEESIFVGNHTAGCYCITTACVKYGATGWILTPARFVELVNTLIRAGSSPWQSLIELFGDAVGSILGARYMPIPYETFDSSLQDEVALGDWNSGVQGIPTDGYVYDTVTINIPWIYSDFRRCSEFTRFCLALPFVGCVDIMSENLVGHDKIHVEYTVNMITGQCAYGVWVDMGIGTPDKLIGSYSCSVGRQVPIATDQINAQGFLGGALTAVGGSYTAAAKNLAFPLGLGGYGGGMLAGAAVIGGIAAATIAANKQDFVTIGGYDGCASEVIFAQFYFFSIANDCRTEPDELTNLCGRPCMKVLSLENLTGFVKTVGFSIDVSAPETIKEMINNALDSGVYLE